MVNVLLKPSGLDTVTPARAYSSRARSNASRESCGTSSWNTAVTAVPVYSTYTSRSPVRNARSQTNVPPRFSWRTTRRPFGLEALREKLSEDHLLGEVLRADDDGALVAARVGDAGHDRERHQAPRRSPRRTDAAS